LVAYRTSPNVSRASGVPVPWELDIILYISL
jgi:hypothetical protein